MASALCFAQLCPLHAVSRPDDGARRGRGAPLASGIRGRPAGPRVGAPAHASAQRPGGPGRTLGLMRTHAPPHNVCSADDSGWRRKARERGRMPPAVGMRGAGKCGQKWDDSALASLNVASSREPIAETRGESGWEGLGSRMPAAPRLHVDPQTRHQFHWQNIPVDAFIRARISGRPSPHSVEEDAEKLLTAGSFLHSLCSVALAAAMALALASESPAFAAPPASPLLEAAPRHRHFLPSPRGAEHSTIASIDALEAIAQSNAEIERPTIRLPFGDRLAGAHGSHAAPHEAAESSGSTEALGRLSSSAGTLLDKPAADATADVEDQEVVTPTDLVLEAWTVVRDTYLDARGGGFTQEKWEATKASILKRGVKSFPDAHSTISSMLGSLKDPYSRFLSPDQFARLAKYDITGVGLNIGELTPSTSSGTEGPGERRPVVVGIVLGSPAYQAGMRQGDELVSVDGQDVRRMSSFDVASLIQGTKGTPVTISVFRPEGSSSAAKGASTNARGGSGGGEVCRLGSTCSFTVLRSADAPATPVAYRLEKRRPAPGLWGSLQPEEQEEPVLSGYIKIKEFNAVAKRDLAEAIRRLQAAGATELVLDLQDNPGGLVQAGVESAKLFLEKGSTVVYTQARGGPASERGVVTASTPLTSVPLTVLVNGRTASASEIVAAALHDNCRAVLVGSTTFGKGLIQSVYELQDGSGMVLTVGKYVTPAHQDIDGNGIVPDFRRAPGIDVAAHRLKACRGLPS